MALAALLALSLYIPFLAGQLSLASPGFYALGGYIAAVLATRVLPVGKRLLPGVGPAPRNGAGGAGLGAAGRRRGRARAPPPGHLLRPGHDRVRRDPPGRLAEPRHHRRRGRDLRRAPAVRLAARLPVDRRAAPRRDDGRDVAPRANAGRPGAGGAPRGRAGRRRHGDQSHVLQDARLHDGRDAGRRGRGRERALPEHLERPPGDVRRERQPPRLRAHRRLAHLPGARRGRPHPDRAARGPPRRGRHRRAPGLARALPQGRAPDHLRHAHRRRQRVLPARTDHAGAPAGAAARPRSTRPVGPRPLPTASGRRGAVSVERPLRTRQRPARPTSRCAACPAASED